MAQYTEKAQEALVLAGEAAEDMGSPVIGTEHILVGLIEEGSADFLLQDGGASADERWASAARFVDSLSRKRSTRFDDMTKAEIKLDRLAAKGLV